MPGQRGSEERRLKSAVLVRMDADLAARCASAASEMNLSVAGWLRRLAVDAVRLDGENMRRSKPRALMKPRPDELTRALVALADRLAEFAATVADLAAVQPADRNADSAVRRANLPALLGMIRTLSADVIAAIERVVRQ